MAVLFGILEELTFHEVAKESVSPTLEGDPKNPLRAWANALKGAARPSDISTRERLHYPLPSVPAP